MKLNRLQPVLNLTWISIIFSTFLSGCVTSKGISARAAANTVESYEAAKRNGLAEEQCRYARAAMQLFLQADDDENVKKWRTTSENDCITQSVEGGRTGRIGVQLTALPRDVQQRLERNSGLFVVAVAASSPAFLANILVGDVITAVNGKQIVDLRDVRLFQSLVRQACESGDALRVSVLRESGKQRDISVVVCK